MKNTNRWIDETTGEIYCDYGDENTDRLHELFVNCPNWKLVSVEYTDKGLEIYANFVGE